MIKKLITAILIATGLIIAIWKINDLLVNSPRPNPSVQTIMETENKKTAAIRLSEEKLRQELPSGTLDKEGPIYKVKRASPLDIEQNQWEVVWQRWSPAGFSGKEIVVQVELE